jgi:predicted SnoaL-like aldol condensation-catalyzing enzyme
MGRYRWEATNSEIENVRSVLEAIKAQDSNRATQYVDTHFVQHYPYTSDGVEGLKQYIDGSTLEQLSLTVVRAFQDGPYVVTQLKAHSHSIRKAIQFHILRSQNLNKGHIFS